MSSITSFHTVVVGVLAASLPLLALASTQRCRFIPGDAGWPSSNEWSQLNDTVQGRLIATVPQASVCHTSPYDNYNATACAGLQVTWTDPQIYEARADEIQNPYFQNQSCDPFTLESRPCELGNYAVYAINVSCAEDAIAGIQFAREKNIRLVVKTTGHDYLGKSTGQGALTLWMFNLKSVEIMDVYKSTDYSGPAAKLGAGLIAGEVYEIVEKAGYRVVGGECASVGIVGGYSQGGGHSMLSGLYGLAADNVLEWGVVTPQGEHLVATPQQNADLYWAVSGGGGGTYAVVLSATVRLHQESTVTSGTLVFDVAGAGNDLDVFWEAVALFFQQMPHLVQTAKSGSNATSNNNTMLCEFTNTTFDLFSIFLPDQTVADLDALLAPYLAQLDGLNINYTYTARTYPTYTEFFNATLGPLPYGAYPSTEVWTSRMIPRSIALNATAAGGLAAAYRAAVAEGMFMVGCNVMDGASAPAHPDNAVSPAWRDIIALCNTLSYWDFEAPLAQNLAVKRELVAIHTPVIEAVTPGSGVYLNEIDPWYEGDWKQEMYGANYDRLLGIKHHYDPDYLLYGQFAVGGDEFTVDGSGRLCVPSY